MVSATYRDLFATVATAAGALTGLLFVALSLVPRRGSGSGLSVIQQVRAAAAWLAFTNALAVALFGLVPGTNVGYPALVLGVIGVVLSLIGTIATWNRGPEFGPKWYPLALIVTAIPTAWIGGKLKS